VSQPTPDEDPNYEVRIPRGAAQYALAWSVKAPRMTDASEILFLQVDAHDKLDLLAPGIPFNVV
jgi:hypothetical protein